jgi:hypothetical protein
VPEYINLTKPPIKIEADQQVIQVCLAVAQSAQLLQYFEEEASVLAEGLVCVTHGFEGLQIVYRSGELQAQGRIQSHVQAHLVTKIRSAWCVRA